MGTLINLTDASFDAEIMRFPGLAVVDFYSTYCAPCKLLKPIIEALAAENEDPQVKLGTLNIDQGNEVAVRLGILGVPVIVFFKNGHEVGRKFGFQPRKELESQLKKFR